MQEAGIEGSWGRWPRAALASPLPGSRGGANISSGGPEPCRAESRARLAPGQDPDAGLPFVPPAL